MKALNKQNINIFYPDLDSGLSLTWSSNIFTNALNPYDDFLKSLDNVLSMTSMYPEFFDYFFKPGELSDFRQRLLDDPENYERLSVNLEFVNICIHTYQRYYSDRLVYDVFYERSLTDEEDACFLKVFDCDLSFLLMEARNFRKWLLENTKGKSSVLYGRLTQNETKTDLDLMRDFYSHVNKTSKTNVDFLKTRLDYETKALNITTEILNNLEA